MNMREFAMANRKPFDQTLIFELYEGSKFDKKASKMIDENRRLFAESKMDNDVFRYNLTGKMSLKKFLSLGMDRETMVHIVRRLLEVEEYFDLNGLNKKYIMYDADLVLVDKETEEVTIIVIPATDHGLTVKALRPFLKEVIANAIYDDEENLDYVGRLLNYVNVNKEIIPGDMEIVLGGIEAASTKAAGSYMNEMAPEVQTPEVGFAFDEAPVEAEGHTKYYDKPEKAIDVIPFPEVHVNEVEEVEEVEEVPEHMPEAEVLQVPTFDIDEEPEADAAEEAPYEEVMPIQVPTFEEEEVPAFEPVETPEVQLNEEPVKETQVIDPVPQQIKVAAPVKKYPYLVRAKNQEIVTIDKDEFKIGKIPGMVDYLLNDNPAVSRMHAIIQHVDKGYYICDNYSTNATYLNGEKLEPGKRYILLNGVKVYIANEEFTFLLEK